MDPAGPTFSIQVEYDRLHKTDAKFVQVLHTNSGKLGFEESLGHADYWPNGGRVQPGCSSEEDVDGMCSHRSAYFYFAESLKSGHFSSWYCKNYEQFKDGSCKHNLKSYFGQVNINKK